MPASQAGRRGFESRLPLQLYNNFADFPSLAFTSFTSKTRLMCRMRNFGLRGGLTVCQLALQFCYSLAPTLEIAFGIRIDGYSDRAITLIRGDLRIDSRLVTKARLRSA